MTVHDLNHSVHKPQLHDSNCILNSILYAVFVKTSDLEWFALYDYLMRKVNNKTNINKSMTMDHLDGVIFVRSSPIVFMTR